MEKTYNKKRPWIRDDKNLPLKLLFFFIWPFGCFLYSIKTANAKTSYIIFFLFSILICWHMTPVNLHGAYDDFIGILLRFQDESYTFQQLLTEISKIVSFDDDAPKEIYEHVLNWFVKCFTDNYHFFFMFASIPVALCQLGTLRRITGDYRYRNDIWGIIALICFIVPRDIITVQNPRFTTGLWICIFFSIQYLCENRKIKYLIPILLAPFIHSGMWLYTIICVMYIFVACSRSIYRLFALITIPLAFFDANLLQNLQLNILPDGLRSWAEYYISDESYSKFVLNSEGTGFAWVTTAFDLLKKIIVVLMTITLIKNEKVVDQNVESSSLYNFYLFLYGVTNIIQFVPVLGARYFWFVQILCFLIWYKTLYYTYRKISLLLLFSYSFGMLIRYGYLWGGALSVTTPLDLYYTPLPYLIISCLNI